MNGWSLEEDQALLENMVWHNSSWPGWQNVLPDKTNRQIRHRMAQIKSGKVSAPTARNPDEDIVMQGMADGMAPSEIDRIMGWVDERSRKICVQCWEREQEESVAYLVRRGMQ